MSRIKELIDELCPDGVEFKLLGEVASVERGVRVVRKQLATEPTDGLYPVYQNALIPLGYHTQMNYPAGTTYIIGAGAAGGIGYSYTDFWAADDCYPIVCCDKVDSRFVYFAITSQELRLKGKVRSGTIPRLSRSDVEALVIPVPPIEVQCEIVHILDVMQELDKALEVEISLRYRQWVYACEKLLARYVGSLADNEKGLPLVKLGDLYKVTSAKRILSDDQTSEGIPFLKVADILDLIEGREITPQSHISEETYSNLIALDMVPKPGDILITARGTLGRFYVVREGDRFYFQDGMVTWLRLTEKSPIQSYFNCVFSNRKFFDRLIANCSGSTVKYLSIKGLANVEIPLPTHEQQTAFDADYSRASALFNLAECLNQELRARRKQFEYYRDRLMLVPAKKR